MKAKTKVSVEEYRSRKEKRDQESIEARKVEQARLHEIEIQQAEIARIKYEQEQLRLEQERVRKEQEANAKLLASQALQAPEVLGSHTPCYDEHGQDVGLP